jgi:hypothetical protein
MLPEYPSCVNQRPTSSVIARTNIFDTMKACINPKEEGRQQDSKGMVLESGFSINLTPRIVYVKDKVHPCLAGAMKYNILPKVSRSRTHQTKMPKAPSKRSLSPCRPRGRGELAASLQALLKNDHVDLEILRPGAPWPSANEITELSRDSNFNQDVATVILGFPKEEIIIDPALSADPFPININLEPDWLSNLMASSRDDEVPEVAEAFPSCSGSDNISTSASTSNTDDLSHFSFSSISQWDALLDSVCSTASRHGPIVETQQRQDQEPLGVLAGQEQGQGQNHRQSGESAGSSASEHPSPRKRQRPHYAIEKRYRAGLQERFEALRDCVASLKQAENEGDDGQDINDTDKAGRMNKAEVLNQATVYIQQLQEENEVAIEHIKLLIKQFRIMKNAMRQALGQI